MPDDSKPRRTGCAILFVPSLIVIDLVGMYASYAGPYVKVVFAVGFVGCLCGAAFGGCLFAKTKLSTNRSLGFCLVFWGLVGLTIPFFIALYIALSCLR